MFQVTWLCLSFHPDPNFCKRFWEISKGFCLFDHLFPSHPHVKNFYQNKNTFLPVVPILNRMYREKHLFFMPLHHMCNSLQ